MKIKELTGYKSHPHFQQASQTFQGDLSAFKPRIDKLEQFQKYMLDNGFKHLGTGSYGSAYIHPTYPWVLKIFTHDPAFLQYIKYIRLHQSNPNVPKTTGPIIRINKNTFVIRLEKLEPIVGKNLSDLMAVIKPLFYARELTTDQKEFLLQHYPGIFEIIDDMDKLPSQPELDLHKGNVLLRNNTPVILDPIVGATYEN
jgi:hypothetical protein